MNRFFRSQKDECEESHYSMICILIKLNLKLNFLIIKKIIEINYARDEYMYEF